MCVEQIAEEQGITYSGIMDKGVSRRTGGGVAMADGDRIGIFVDQDLPPRTKKFVDAHELGHVLLGHLDGCSSRRREKEWESDVFAIVLCALDAAGLMRGEARK